LPLECNFPYHLADTFAPSPLQALGVVHYHDRANDDGTLLPTGNNVANEAARAIAIALGRARKRRLIVHAGAPKTGTTSLQRFLTDRGDELRTRGLLYPKTGLDEGPDPKHHWLVRCLLLDDEAEFDRYLALVESEADDDTHTIVLSNEGVSNHWWYFRPAARHVLATLSERYSVSLVLWLREPVAFYRSYYLQSLRNPRVDISPGYGVDLAPEHALDLPWVAKHLDYAGLVRDMAAVFGEDATFVFAYRDDTLETAAKLLDFPWDPSSERVNTTTLHESGVEMLRVINRYDLAPPEKERAYAMIAAIDRTIGSQNAPFALSADTCARVQSLCTLTREELAALDAASTARWFAR